MNIKVKRIRPNAVLPSSAHPREDLCYDLFAAADAVLYAFHPTKVPTGICVEPPQGFGLLIRPRSSMSLKGVLLGGGEVDYGFRDEVQVILTYITTPSSATALGQDAYHIKAGDRIAQMRLEPIRSHIEVVEVTGDLNKAKRSGGFGSTGR